MATITPEIRTRVTADGSQFLREMSRLTNRVETLDRQLQDTRRSTERFAGSFKKLGGILGAVFTVQTVRTIADANAQLAEMLRTAQNLGVSVENFQALTLAAKQYGVTQDELSDGLSNLSEKVTEYVKIGSGEAVDFFEKLNIDAKEFDRLAPDEMFIKLFEALSQVETVTERNLYLQQLMGDTGQKLSQVAEDGAKSFRELANSMSDTGMVLSEDMLKQSKELDEVFKRLGSETSAQFQQFLIVSTPLIKTFAGWIETAAKFWTEFADSLRNDPLLKTNIVEDLTEQQQKLERLQKRLESKRGGLSIYASPEEVERRKSEIRADIAEQEKLVAKSQAKLDAIYYPTAGKKSGIIAPQAGAAALGTGPGTTDSSTSGPSDVDKDLLKRFQAGNQLYQRQAELAERQKQLTRETALSQFQSLKESLLSEEEAIRLSYQKRLEVAQRAAELEPTLQKEANEQIVEARRERDEELSKLEQEQQTQRLQQTSDMFGNIAQLAKEGGEKTQKIAKAAAITQATIDGVLAVQKALASAPPPLNFINAAVVGTMAALNVAKISGIAHSGMSNVPSEGTYLLNKGERVLSPNQNSDLNSFMKQGGGVSVNVHNYSGEKVSTTYDNDQIQVFVGAAKASIRDDVRRGIGIDRDMRQSYGLTRRGTV